MLTRDGLTTPSMKGGALARRVRGSKERIFCMRRMSMSYS